MFLVRHTVDLEEKQWEEWADLVAAEYLLQHGGRNNTREQADEEEVEEEEDADKPEEDSDSGDKSKEAGRRIRRKLV